MAAHSAGIASGGHARLGGNDDAAAAAIEAAELLQDAAVSLAEAEGARDRVEALTETVRAYEEGLSALREGVRQAALRERAILPCSRPNAKGWPLLAVLQSIQSAPAPLLLLHPDGPVGTARAGMIVADVTPAVAREAQALRAQLEELASLRAVQEAGLSQLSDGLAGFRPRGPTCRRPSPSAERCRRRWRSMPRLCRNPSKRPVA
jgi:septal ring factor EnvC (AmiA/AmiB activator)